MRLSIIVAVAENGVIGRDNDLPWRISADLKRFKALTWGHHLFMGRKTFESIGRALPGRTTIVLSRGTPDLPAGVALAHDLDQAIDLARSAGETEAFVAGGAGGQIERDHAGVAVVGLYVSAFRVHLRPLHAINDAIGLFAAIPAVVAYNRYVHDIDRLAIHFESFMEEFSNILHRQASR